MRKRLTNEEYQGLDGFHAALVADGYQPTTAQVYTGAVSLVLRSGGVAAALATAPRSALSRIERASRLYNVWAQEGHLDIGRKAYTRTERRSSRVASVTPFHQWMLDEGRAESTARNYDTLVRGLLHRLGDGDLSDAVWFSARLNATQPSGFVQRTKHLKTAWRTFTAYRHSIGHKTSPLDLAVSLSDEQVMAIFILADIFGLKPKQLRSMKRETYRWRDEPKGCGIWYDPSSRREEHARGTVSWAHHIWLQDGKERGPLFVDASGDALGVHQIEAQLDRVHDIVVSHGEPDGYHWLPQRWAHEWSLDGYPAAY